MYLKTKTQASVYEAAVIGQQASFSSDELLFYSHLHKYCL